MAKKVENSKNFLVINMNNKEASRIGFGIPDKGCICMHCNDIIKDDIYYIAVLNDTMCKECYDEFMESAHNYQEDRLIEERNFNYVNSLLESNITINPQYPTIIEL